MQLKIAKTLNFALIIVTLLTLSLVAGGLYVHRAFPDFRYYYIAVSVILSIIFMAVFRYLEANWDKNIIIRMTLEGKIAFVNIESSERERLMRDSSFTAYWLYRFEGKLYPQNGKSIAVTFYEKMSRRTTEIPTGSIYVTYDERKPEQIFIIPTDLLVRIPGLEKITAAYEKRNDIDCRYLYAYNNQGMELKNYRDVVKKEREKRSD